MCEYYLLWCDDKYWGDARLARYTPTIIAMWERAQTITHNYSYGKFTHTPGWDER